MGSTMSNILNWIIANGSASEWLTAIGTVGAVCFSLYLSVGKNRSKVQIVTKFRDQLPNKFGMPYFDILIRNLGTATVFISYHGTMIEYKNVNRIESVKERLDIKINSGEDYHFQINVIDILNNKRVREIDKSDEIELYYLFESGRGEVFKTRKLEELLNYYQDLEKEVQSDNL